MPNNTGAVVVATNLGSEPQEHFADLQCCVRCYACEHLLLEDRSVNVHMGCFHSTPYGEEPSNARMPVQSSRPAQASFSNKASRFNYVVGKARSTMDLQYLEPQEVLDLAVQMVQSSFADRLEPVILATIALIESSGQANKAILKEEIGEHTLGICQVPVSTARWLASEKGYDVYGEPTASTLLDPRTNMYFAAAYLQDLSTFEGQQRPEEFVVRAYHSGPKCWDEKGSEHYWALYIRCKTQLKKLSEALRQARNSADQYTMHVVQPGEALERIATICGVTVEKILEANPEVGGASFVQPNDCIAIPVAVVPPRLYVARPGDSLAQIAKRKEVSLARLLAKNPELALDPGHLAPGWTLVLPGLRNNTLSSSRLDMMDVEQRGSAASAVFGSSGAGGPAPGMASLASIAGLGASHSHMSLAGSGMSRVPLSRRCALTAEVMGPQEGDAELPDAPPGGMRGRDRARNRIHEQLHRQHLAHLQLSAHSFAV